MCNGKCNPSCPVYSLAHEENHKSRAKSIEARLVINRSEIQRIIEESIKNPRKPQKTVSGDTFHEVYRKLQENAPETPVSKPIDFLNRARKTNADNNTIILIPHR